MKNYLIYFITLNLSLNVLAADSLSTKIHNQYQSLRAMGMGNAFTNVADDYTALLYNPATLAKRKRGEIQYTLVGAGISTNTTKIMTEISDAEKSAGADPNLKATAISNVLDKYYGKPLGGRVQAMEFFWVRPNWGVALIPVDLSVDLSVNRQLGPALDLNIKKDTTLAYGYGKEIMPNISAGVLTKIIHRDSVEQSVSAMELGQNSDVFSKDRFKEGINIDAEIGFLWTPEFTQTTIIKKIEPTADQKIEAAPVEKLKTDEEKKSEEALRNPQSEEIAKIGSIQATVISTDVTVPKAAITAPVVEEKKPAEPVAAEVKKIEPVPETKNEIYNPLTISAVIRNLISTNYSKSTLINKESTTAPEKNPRVIDIGAGYEISNWGALKLLATVEAKNLLHPETTVKKSSHAGLELDYSPGTWFKTQVRAGVNQMYFTAGLTLLLGVVEIDTVTYGEEVGTATTNVENRVSAIKLGFNF